MKRLIFFVMLVVKFASAAELISQSGTVKFTAIGKPGFLKIRGESKGSYPNGKIKIDKNAINGEFSFDLKSLDTGIELRNEHMKDKYLEVSKYATAKLTLTPITSPSSELKDMKEKFTGELSLHGVTKKIDGNYQYWGKDKKVKADFEIKVSDFKIDIPKYLGVTVSETVQIEIEITLK